MDDGTKNYDVPNILGADHVSCGYDLRDGLYIYIKFLKTNPLAKKVKKELLAFF